jgi:PAS domain S-box-containing protein
VEFRTGDALLVFDDGLNVVAWNAAAEELTGIPAEDAVGRPCWDVLGGVDERGSLVCHGGCSGARLAREGWPVHCQRMLVRTRSGRRRVTVSTIAIRGESGPLYLHLLRDGLELPDDEALPPERHPQLTPRQLEVLRLAAGGLSARAIAAELEIAEPTVRNHIRAILRELGAHSQLAAVATARRLRLVD